MAFRSSAPGICADFGRGRSPTQITRWYRSAREDPWQLELHLPPVLVAFFLIVSFLERLPSTFYSLALKDLLVFLGNWRPIS